MEIDIALPSPGVPADRGVAAFQFSLLYDPSIVWVSGDEAEMLLAQAPGSKLIPIADPKPDTNGVYLSWGVDFGPSGIEPAGSSEIGPGVLSRITLLPQNEGSSSLILSGALVIDDSAERITLESVRPATIKVGQPCPSPQAPDNNNDEAVQQDGRSNSPPNRRASIDDAPQRESPPTEAAGNAGPVAVAEIASGPPVQASAIPSGGGSPPAGVSSHWPIIAGGLAAAVAGAGLVADGIRRHTAPVPRRRAAGPNSSRRHRQ